MLAQVVFMFVCGVHWTDGRSVFETMEPGTVLSRFDYDYEVLKKIIELEKKVDDVGEPKTGCQTTNCPDGWLAYKGSCYLFGPNSVNFQSAKDYCMLHDSRLVWVQTETENIFLKTYMGNNLNENADFWLGINDDKEEGVWLFTGTELDVYMCSIGVQLSHKMPEVAKIVPHSVTGLRTDG